RLPTLPDSALQSVSRTSLRPLPVARPSTKEGRGGPWACIARCRTYGAPPSRCSFRLGVDPDGAAAEKVVQQGDVILIGPAMPALHLVAAMPSGKTPARTAAADRYGAARGGFAPTARRRVVQGHRPRAPAVGGAVRLRGNQAASDWHGRCRSGGQPSSGTERRAPKTAIDAASAPRGSRDLNKKRTVVRAQVPVRVPVQEPLPGDFAHRADVVECAGGAHIAG